MIEAKLFNPFDPFARAVPELAWAFLQGGRLLGKMAFLRRQEEGCTVTALGCVCSGHSTLRAVETVSGCDLIPFAKLIFCSYGVFFFFSSLLSLELRARFRLPTKVYLCSPFFYFVV